MKKAILLLCLVSVAPSFAAEIVLKSGESTLIGSDKVSCEPNSLDYRCKISIEADRVTLSIVDEKELDLSSGRRGVVVTVVEDESYRSGDSYTFQIAVARVTLTQANLRAKGACR